MGIDELQELISVFAFELVNKYDMEPRDAAILLDTFKLFAAEYHALVEAGEIPPAQQYKKDVKKALDFMNKELDIEL